MNKSRSWLIPSLNARRLSTLNEIVAMASKRYEEKLFLLEAYFEENFVINVNHVSNLY